MVVMDPFTRKIVGFSVRQGSLSGGNICYMDSKIASGKDWPRYISPDHDPLFNYWLWKVNLENNFNIQEIKSAPYCPWSHPFIERLIGSWRREFTDYILFWSESDLLAKLLVFQEYFSFYRVHYNHGGETPNEITDERQLASIDLKNFKWKPVCGGMYYTPIAA